MLQHYTNIAKMFFYRLPPNIAATLAIVILYYQKIAYNFREYIRTYIQISELNLISQFKEYTILIFYSFYIYCFVKKKYSNQSNWPLRIFCIFLVTTLRNVTIALWQWWGWAVSLVSGKYLITISMSLQSHISPQPKYGVSAMLHDRFVFANFSKQRGVVKKQLLLNATQER